MVTREILVIDDDKLTRWWLAKVLARFGYRVREAASAAEGLASAREFPPDLVLLDIRLLDGDGGTVLQDLRQSCPGLPVVMMSADATPETVRHMRSLGPAASSRSHVRPCSSRP